MVREYMVAWPLGQARRDAPTTFRSVYEARMWAATVPGAVVRWREVTEWQDDNMDED